MEDMEIDEKLRTDKITPELINYVVEKIVHAIQPEKIILYGSYLMRVETTTRIAISTCLLLGTVKNRAGQCEIRLMICFGAGDSHLTIELLQALHPCSCALQRVPETACPAPPFHNE